MRKTKIICTLGPASQTEKVIEEMFKKGMNVVRINLSHSNLDNHKKTIDTFKSVREKLGLPAAIILDTRGPEIRTGYLKDGSVNLNENENFVFTTKEILGDKNSVSISFSALPSLIKNGDIIKVDDGKLSFTVLETNKTDIICTVNVGGTLGNQKSINIPGVRINMPYLSNRDKDDIIFGIENDIDYIAASFVRSASDVIALRKFINYHGGHNIKIISKIENIEGIEAFDQILLESDGIMIARGDMGVEVEYEKLPGIQKRFIRKCYGSGKIVITATQMLESMQHAFNPTRAEITDVANAVFDGTSAVMLSGETAMGVHPARVVGVMSKIAEQAESDALALDMFANRMFYNDTTSTNAICDAACTTAKDLGAAAVIVVTKSGYSARRLSKFRPSETIVAATPEEKTFHQMSLSWGVHPVLAIAQESEEKLFQHALDCAKQIDVVKKGDTVVIIGGTPINVSGNTNTLKVLKAN